MKALWTKELFIGTILLLSFTQIYGAEISSRRITVSQQNPMVAQPKPTVVKKKSMVISDKPKNDVNLKHLADYLGTIPYIGGSIKGSLNYIGELIINTNQLTNGAIARILGGSLPCVITLKKGITCSGTSVKGGVYGIFEDMTMGLPPRMMPMWGKKLILFFVKIGLNPAADVLFGGNKKANKKVR